MERIEGAETAPLRVTVTDGTSGPVVELVGELDLSNVESLDDILAQVLEAHPARITLDVTGLRFMDSSGLALLLRTNVAVESLTLVHPSELIRRVIEGTGLTEILRMEP
jgi:anti-anti-sigma factor